MRIELCKSARLYIASSLYFYRAPSPYYISLLPLGKPRVPPQTDRPSPTTALTHSLALQSHLQDTCEPTHSLRQVMRLFPRKAEAKLVSKAIRWARRFIRHLEKIATRQT